MFCQICGKERAGKGKFCSGCGTKFIEEDLEKTAKGINIFPMVAATFLLLVAIFSDSMPIGFFTLLRWAVMGASIYYAYEIYQKKVDTDFWFWVFVILAVLFNPLIPIYLAKDTWKFIDFMVAVAFVAFSPYLKKIH